MAGKEVCTLCPRMAQYFSLQEGLGSRILFRICMNLSTALLLALLQSGKSI